MDKKAVVHIQSEVSQKEKHQYSILTQKGFKKRWQEYVEVLYKKDLYEPYNHDGVITHLEPDLHSQVSLRKNHYEQC